MFGEWEEKRGPLSIFFYMISDATPGAKNLAAVMNARFNKTDGDSYEV